MAKRTKAAPERSEKTRDETRDAIVDAFLALAADTPFGAIEPRAIAERAGVDLATLRREFRDPLAILAAFSRRIDAAVLEGDDPAMRDEPAKDRLFDVLMRRLDHLSPHKAALKGLFASARRDPAFAAALGGIGLGAQRWMLAAAGIEQGGLLGFLKANALTFAFARVMETFLDEDDPGLPRTMAELDRMLERLGGWARRAERFAAFVPGRFRSRGATAAPAEDEAEDGPGAALH